MQPEVIGIEPEYFMNHSKLITGNIHLSELEDLIWVSCDGIVYNQSTNNFLKPEPCYDKSGKLKYYRVCLKRHNGMMYHYKIHRLVAIAWVSIPIIYQLSGIDVSSLHVHHLDSDVSNNSAYNLKWATAKKHSDIHIHNKRSGIDAFQKKYGRRYRNMVPDDQKKAQALIDVEGLGAVNE